MLCLTRADRANLTPTADMAADHAALAALFRGIEPKHKQRLSLPLREN